MIVCIPLWQLRRQSVSILGFLLLLMVGGAPSPPEAAAQQPSRPENSRPPAATETAADPTEPTVAPASSSPAQPVVTQAMVESRLQAVEANESLDAAAREQAVELYRQTLTQLEAIEGVRAAQADWQTKTQSVASDLTQQRQQAAELSANPPPRADPAAMTQEKLDELVRQLQRQADDLQQQLTTLQAEPKQRADRRLEIPQRVAELAESRARYEEAYVQALAASPPAPVADALKLLHDLRLENIREQVDLLQDELAFYDAATDLLPAQIELMQVRMQQTSEDLAYWANVAGERRRERVEQDLEEKATTASEVPEELKPLAVRNLELSEQRRKLAEQIETVRRQLTETRDDLSEAREQFTRIQDLIRQELGVTESVGSLLRQQQADLPDVRSLRRKTRANHGRVYEVRSANFAINEERIALQDLDRRVDRQLQQLAQQGVSAERRAELEPEVRRLLAARAETLKELAGEYEEYTSDLVRYNIGQEQYVKLIERYTNFIEEHVLWIRSIPPIALGDLQSAAEAMRRLFDRNAWPQLGRSAWQTMQDDWLTHVAVALIVVLCFAYRQRAVTQLRELGDEAASRTCRSFAVTVRAVLWTFVVSANGPLFLIWLAWLLADLNATMPLAWTPELEVAAQRSAFVYWPIAFWIHTVRPKGLAENHFAWSEISLRLTRRNLRWLGPVLVPATAFFYLFQSTEHPRWEQSIGRLAIVVATLSVAWFFRQMGSPHRGVFQEYLGHNQNSWTYRLRFFWYAALVAVPVFFALLALAGYQYTAQRLSECLYLSAVFLSGVLLSEALSVRWLTLNRRSLAMAQARERLATGQVTPQEKKPPELAGGVTSNEMVDLHAVNVQTLRLVTSFGFIASLLGLYLIWVDVLPALGRLNSVTLWQTDTATNVVPLETPAADGSGGTPVPQPALETERPEWITLGNLIGSLVLLAMTWIAVRNIPGLLEIAVLQHLPLDAALRYAFTTVTRYALILFGLAFAFGNVGVGWSKIQWLAAGVSVGLGFGLQEIFANFISGLILLFERPLRAGDIVTVGDVTGTVVQIKTRATTIQDWDRKELVVPNKEFITSRLLNWTLTDTVNRLVISVGVAYGSDVQRVRELLLKAAADHPDVMDDPAPNVTFDLFGDSALNFTLRCYLATLEQRLSATHELHEMIYRAFHDAGVVIPFPQRDVHVYKSLEVRG